MLWVLFRLLAVALLFALVLKAVGWLPRRLGMAGAEADPPAGVRLAALDGLRGALALAVVFAHADATRSLFSRGIWANPTTPLRTGGELAVSLFFGITGFLFWDRAMDGRIRARTLYPRRLLRVYPLYLFVAAAAVLLSLLARPFEADGWSLLIVVTKLVVPGRGLEDSINDVDVVRWLGQAWTLHYELLFYLALPLLAPLARRRGSAFAIAGAALVAWAQLPTGTAFDPHGRIVLPLFAAGMVAAEVARWEPAASALRGALGGRVALGAALVYLGLPPGYPLVGAFAALAILLPFVCGGDPFGRFAGPSLRRLGEVSYSVYLTHNLVLFGGMALLNAVAPIKALAEPLYWIAVAPVVVLVVALSLATFRFLERPFMGERPLPAADAAP